MTVTYHAAPAPTIDPLVLYRILELRVRVFVVEQQAAYADLDGRDVEPGARLMWAADEGGVVATLRLLRDEDGMRIGRVATAERARGGGVASELMRRAVGWCTEVAPALPIRLDAQEHLASWYARFGFAVVGERFFDDGIPHLPMTRDAA